MGFVAPDLLVESRLRAGILAICENPDLLDDPFENFDPRGVAEVKGFFLKRDIPVRSGYPVLGTTAPCILVQLAPKQEEAERQPIGPLDMYHDEGALITVKAAPFRSTVRIICLGNNQPEATFVALAVEWLLLAERDVLEQYGLLEQTLAVYDFEPVPQVSNPQDIWFQRIVTVNSTHWDTWRYGQGPLIAGVTVDAYATLVDLATPWG